MNILSISLLLANFILIQSQSYTCVKSGDASQSYQRGDNIVICIHYVSNPGSTTPTVQRMYYQIKVDQYSALLAKNAFQNFQTARTSSVTLVGQAGAYPTPTSQTTYLTTVEVYPQFSIVVQLVSGVITDIVWDNVCFSGSTCDSTQGNDFQALCTTSTDYPQCDPKVYVSFLGTDSKGNYMTSGGMRMSRFRQFSTSEVYANSLTAFSNYESQAQSAIGQ